MSSWREAAECHVKNLCVWYCIKVVSQYKEHTSCLSKVSLNFYFYFLSLPDVQNLST